MNLSDIVLEFGKDDKFTTNITLNEKEQVVIFINERYSKEWRNFIAAHQFGHLMLGSRCKCQEDEKFLLLYSDKDEIMANKYAVRLLMPDWYIDAAGKNWILKNLSQCAKEFQVPESILDRRISGLLGLDNNWN